MHRTILIRLACCLLMTVTLNRSNAFGHSIYGSENDSASAQEAVAAYHKGLESGQPTGVRGVIGDSFYMFNGRFSGDPLAWEAHQYLAGEDLDLWPEMMIAQAGPFENEFKFLHTSVVGNAALVVTEETGRNRFRSWQDETVVWMLGRTAGGWKITAMFVRDIENPSHD